MYWLGKWVYHLCRQFGCDPLQFFRALAGLPAHLKNLFLFRARMPRRAGGFAWGAWMPCLGDRFEASGQAKGHYFHQDLWAAQQVYKNQAHKHVDIGSRLDGFVAHVAAFRELEVFDVRPQTVKVPNVTFKQADIADVALELSHYCDSVSCLSVLEHIGLGRYGDPLDYLGYRQAWENIYRLLKPEGRFYFSVPIGSNRIEFDAHRVFSLKHLETLFEGKYRLRQFAYVTDAGDLVVPPQENRTGWESNFGCHFGCGLFELEKIKSDKVKA